MKTQTWNFLAAALMITLIASTAQAEGAGPAGAAAEEPGGALMKSEGPKPTTNINFEETLLEGQFRMPAGSYLQGRKIQGKSQMVKLRSDFRSNVRESKSGVRALSK